MKTENVKKVLKKNTNSSKDTALAIYHLVQLSVTNLRKWVYYFNSIYEQFIKALVYQMMIFFRCL